MLCLGIIFFLDVSPQPRYVMNELRPWNVRW
jgi:hypothetical protein